MMNAAIVHGAELRDGRVTSTVRDADGTTVKGVEVDGSVIDADAVVIAMGPGSLLAAQWMSLPAIHGERSPSIVYDTGTPVSADALFLEMEIYGKTTPIEVFPRPDGSTYVTACPDTAAFPTDPADVKPEPNLMDWLQQMSERLSPLFRPEKIIAKQACFRPVTEDGLPLIGRVPRNEGLHVVDMVSGAYPQCARKRRSASGVDCRRRSANRRPRSIRSCPPQTTRCAAAAIAVTRLRACAAVACPPTKSACLHAEYASAVPDICAARL